VRVSTKNSRLHGYPHRIDIEQIALRIFATAKWILSELPELPCAVGDLRHRTLSSPQRLRGLFRGKYSCSDAPLSSFLSVYHIFFALSRDWGYFVCFRGIFFERQQKTAEDIFFIKNTLTKRKQNLNLLKISP